MQSARAAAGTRAGAGAGAAVRPSGGVGGVHCSSLYHGWSDDSPVDRGQCAPLLPTAIIEADGWLVGVHMDRAPSSPPLRRLRGSAAAATPRCVFVVLAVDVFVVCSFQTYTKTKCVRCEFDQFSG